ncbi:carbohydrate-binding family 9-like protein [Flavobacterium sharifuzzamanii]|uniref:carbohydrate-binding family 9-like protein n=1 Tax=Flavobacterium sharifuzzamanii TaxID=2211133 RepID=UPI000DAE367B|nr:carbohydrate-binding family 9-like protein [Flavobacterium sharifuzzamanii]KAF2080028.1 carbohydrate-binding family 9-like protein [Flavobacterium sharifuzzamanii]
MHSRSKLLSLAVFFVGLMGYAQSEKEVTPKSYIAYKASKEIVIDGEGTDKDWEKATWTTPFVDIEGVEKPKYNTQVKMLWDDNYYYILAKIEEPHVWANLRQRDTIIFYNNDFEVFIDPDNDTHNYYELEINALNTAWDLFINKPYREKNTVLNDWNITGLKSAVKVDGTLNNASDIDKGWTLEIAIPWSVYKTSYFDDIVPKDKFWKVNFSRVNWQHSVVDGKYERKKDSEGKFLPEYNWVWSPMGVINMHEPEKWAYVYFSSKEIGGQDTFTIPQEEKVKWELYTLYRAQKRYFDKNKSWAKSLQSISTKNIVVDGKVLKPVLENHSSGFNILVKSPFSNKTLIIKEDGKIITNE